MISVVAAVLLSTVGCLGDLALRKAGASPGVRWGWFAAGVGFYLATVPGWFFVMRYLKFPVLGAVSAVASVLMLTAIGIFVFKDSVRPSEGVGIAMAVCSLVLLSRYA